MRTLVAASLCIAWSLMTSVSALAQVARVTATFETIAGDGAETKPERNQLVLICITNDIDGQSVAPRQASAPVQQARLALELWCGPELGRAISDAIDQRQDLAERLIVQTIRAGLPSSLSGGSRDAVAGSTVLAVCDHHYRTLAVSVGVPSATNLLTLLEDAEEVWMLLDRYGEDPLDLAAAVAERSEERVSSQWRRAIREAIDDLASDQGLHWRSASELSTDWIHDWNDKFEPLYLQENRRRFGLSGTGGLARLKLLEQHVETRRDYCETMIPWVAGIEFTRAWRTIIELVWGHPPIIDEPSDDLLDWYDKHAAEDLVVLSLRPPLKQSHRRWPPVTDQKDVRGRRWRSAHAQALGHPFRVIDAQQLSQLIRHRDLRPIDIYRPGLVRYVILEPKRSSPHLVRETDPPGRLANLLKRQNRRIPVP